MGTDERAAGGGAPPPAVTAGAEHDDGEAGSTAPAAARHGVLFVHGLGQQPQSDTLLGFGRPLVDWVLRWYAARQGLDPSPEGAPAMESAALGFWPFDPGEPDFQPRACLRLPRPDGRADTWVLAEAWWAASNQRPDFPSMLGWTVRYLWIAIVGLLKAARVRLWRLITRGGKPHSTDPGWLARAVDFANTGVAAIVYGLAGLAGYLVLIPLMLLARIPIPGLQDFILVRLIQPLLQMQIGEFRTYVEDEIQAANMRRRVAESICWLLKPEAQGGGGCHDVTIIAHSAGTLLSFGALTDAVLRQPGEPLGDGHLERVRKLVTVGAGLNKAWRFYPHLARLRGPLPGHIHWLDFWTAYDPVPAGPLTPPKDARGAWVTVFDPDPSVVATQHLEPRATPDPHAGELPAQRRRANERNEAGLRYWPVSEEVTNRMVVLFDHGLYWANDEQVLSRLAAEVDAPYYAESRFWRGNGIVSAPDWRTPELTGAVRARRVRVAWLAALRALCIAAGVTIAAVAWARGLTRPQGALGQFITHYLLGTGLFQPLATPLDALFTWLHSLAQTFAPPLVRVVDVLQAVPAVFLGSLVVNLPVIVAYFVLIGWLWDRVDAAARRRAVARIARAGSGPAAKPSEEATGAPAPPMPAS